MTPTRIPLPGWAPPTVEVAPDFGAAEHARIEAPVGGGLAWQIGGMRPGIRRRLGAGQERVRLELCEAREVPGGKRLQRHARFGVAAPQGPSSFLDVVLRHAGEFELEVVRREIASPPPGPLPTNDLTLHLLREEGVPLLGARLHARRISGIVGPARDFAGAPAPADSHSPAST